MSRRQRKLVVGRDNVQSIATSRLALVLGLAILSGVATWSRTEGSAVRFQNATWTTRLLFRHHPGPPVPPILTEPNTRFGGGVSVSDYDNDGDQDVYFSDAYFWPNRLFRNNGDGTFSDVTAETGVGSRAYSHMSLFLDLNNDGFDDLVVINDNSSQTRLFPGSQIYRNNRDGTFSNVTRGSGFSPVETVFGGATAGDYDKDGDLDILLVGWYAYSTYLYRNEGQFRFVDVTDDAGVRPSDDRAQWTPVFADLDNDGWQDIFCAVDFGEDYLLHNNHDGTFTDVSALAGTVHVGNDMGVAVSDFDDDLDPDVYSTNITSVEGAADGDYCNLVGCNVFYINNGAGQFHDEAFQRGVGDTNWGWGVGFFDAELDGDRDLLAVNGWTQPEWHTPATFFLNDGRGYFIESGANAGIAHVGNTRSMVPFDFDADGDIDIVMTDVHERATVYENVSDRGDNHYLLVEAEGIESNRNGVGARVYVTAGGVIRMQEIIAGGSFYAGPPLEAHFGLGPAGVVDELRVVFPSGRSARFFDVPVDQRVTVMEPLP